MIGLYASADCSGCRTDIGVGQQKTLYLRAAVSNAPGSISAAEFRIVGLPAGWTSRLEPGPEVTIVIGHPFGPVGTTIGFSTYQQSKCIDLGTVLVEATTDDRATLEVVAVDPALPSLECPTVQHCMGGCDSDLRICASGDVFYINTGEDCDVGTEVTTWSRVKALYARQ
jgi:hypothetical protein